MQYTQFTKGYSLIETLVAVSVLLIATVGPLTIAAKGIQVARNAQQQVTATFLAQEGIEAVVAARNNSILAAFDAEIAGTGDLSDSWDWVDDPRLAPCFAAGCNLDFKGADTTNRVRSCASGECAVHYYDGDYVPYGTNNAGVPTPYTRVINLTAVGSGEVRITSTVSWNSTLYRSAPESVTLHSTVFSLYE
tara:strand:- start:510 stop:1085 length:576 start_codon:yes stop_codon:yes gene_type:complete